MRTQVKITFGVDSITKTFDVPVTAAQVKAAVKSALGFGDNVNILLNGVALQDNTNVPNNASLVIETKCNSKALALLS